MRPSAIRLKSSSDGATRDLVMFARHSPGAPRLGRGVGPERWLPPRWRASRTPCSTPRCTSPRRWVAPRAPFPSLPRSAPRPPPPLLPRPHPPAPRHPLRVRVPQDSFLLVDVLAEEWRTRLSLDPPSVVVEVGSGTGYVIASAALLHVASCGAASARPASASFYATDVNHDAVASTRATLAAHGVLSRDDDDDPSLSAAGGIRTHCLRCDLLGPLRSDLAGRVDLLLFNPPYVLTPSEEVGSASIAAAWAGGTDGREVIDRLLPDVGVMLSPGGTFLLLLLEQNRPEDVKRILEAQGLAVTARVEERSADEERLCVLRAVKPKERACD